jgi:type II secretory ATPase GspE/PulE/Tfp pilus assembly ATPase PilB-like protein
MFDVLKRVQTAGYRPNLHCATEDLIQLSYHRLKSSELAIGEEETEIEKLITTIVDEAELRKASDIHIETRGDKADIFFRVNGLRVFYANIVKSTAQGIGRVLYGVHADAGSKDVTWTIQDVADSSIEWSSSIGTKLQLRFSSSPIHPFGNFHIVIRVLCSQAKVPPIKSLGYSSEQEDLLDIMSSGSNGIVLMCGPTNSGKSTGLQSLVGRLFERRGAEIKIITVEDPVEYLIPGACQIPVARKRTAQQDPNTGSAFTTFLRGTLRQDPDVVLVGEIRDLDSAVVTRDLILAGRKVFATLHANSALWAFVRLREIGLPWEVLTMPGFIAGICYQRLLPVLCPKCSIKATDPGSEVGGMTEELIHRMQFEVDFGSDDVRVRGKGCAHCKETGVIGRTTVAEFVLPDRTLLGLLSERRFLEAERHWRAGASSFARSDQRACITVLQHAIEKMKQGILSPVDIENQIGVITSDMVMEDGQISPGEVPLLSGKR